MLPPNEAFSLSRSTHSSPAAPSATSFASRLTAPTFYAGRHHRRRPSAHRHPHQLLPRRRASCRCPESSLRGELAEDVLQDAAVLEVEDLLGSIDADPGFEGFGVADGIRRANGDRVAIGEF